MVLNIVSSTILYAPYTWLTFIWRHCVLVLEIPLGGLDVYSSLKLLVVIPRSGKIWCGLGENGCFMSQMSQCVMSHESMSQQVGSAVFIRSVQNADCRPGTKCRLSLKYRLTRKTVFFCVRNEITFDFISYMCLYCHAITLQCHLP